MFDNIVKNVISILMILIYIYKRSSNDVFSIYF
jgi:hypothetical protein